MKPLLILLLAGGTLSGCSSVHTYPDYPQGSYSWESDRHHHVDPATAKQDYQVIFQSQGPLPGG